MPVAFTVWTRNFFRSAGSLAWALMTRSRRSVASSGRAGAGARSANRSTNKRRRIDPSARGDRGYRSRTPLAFRVREKGESQLVAGPVQEALGRLRAHG